jgi:hypothetical protein
MLTGPKQERHVDTGSLTWREFRHISRYAAHFPPIPHFQPAPTSPAPSSPNKSPKALAPPFFHSTRSTSPAVTTHRFIATEYRLSLRSPFHLVNSDSQAKCSTLMHNGIDAYTAAIIETHNAYMYTLRERPDLSTGFTASLPVS